MRKTKPATSTAISDSEVSDVHDTTGQGHENSEDESTELSIKSSEDQVECSEGKVSDNEPALEPSQFSKQIQ